jgi:hypothetical protein
MLNKQNTAFPRTPTEENKAHKNWKIKIRTYHFDVAAATAAAAVTATATATAASGRCLSLIGH